MKAEEKAIWDQHQTRLMQISRDRENVIKDYSLRMQAIRASLEKQPQILARERQIIEKETTAKLSEIDKLEKAEIGRYMSEIEQYDETNNLELNHGDSLKQEKARKVEALLKQMNQGKEKEIVAELTPKEKEQQERDEKVKQLTQQMNINRDDIKDRGR